MRIPFSKYQGAGNDFILIDDRGGRFPEQDNELIHRLCDRHFGVGADGLMLLRSSTSCDFKMLYYNSDGKEGTMCGNGGRCMVAFARDIGMLEPGGLVNFDAVDGEHAARIIDRDTVSVKMKDVAEIYKMDNGWGLNTGSVHHVEYVDKLVEMDVYGRGKAIREHKMYAPAGCNVNFIKVDNDGALEIRTYERGVENETLACGTGSVAAAIVHHHLGHVLERYTIRARGGTLSVRFDHDKGVYKNIWLEGPATFVFKGEWTNE
jgi:diaminopimelate epimerase